MQTEPRDAPAPNDAILARLKTLHPRVIDLSLDRIHDLLERLGAPHRRLPPVVHVAGTNGKGSVVAFLRAFLEAAGYAVHVYTSPHLVRFNERIRLAGCLIDDGMLAEVLAECERVNAGRPITLFEITTAAAFLAFARVPADALVLEVGLGGRLDATNVVAHPLVTTITPVSLDHQHYLGDTIAKIAGEKAGIIKPAIPCVVAAQEPAAAEVIVARARALRAPLSREGVEWSVARRNDGFQFMAGDRILDLPSPALPGEHQIHNAGTAIACLPFLSGVSVPETAVIRGLTTVEWPARLQRLRRGPLVDSLPAEWELWLDGGHNPGAGQVLARHLDGWRDRPLHLIVGMLTTKDAAGFLKPLVGRAAGVRTVPISGEANAIPAPQLAEAARTLGARAEPATDVATALADLVAGNPRPGRVLICGSLYLAGIVLAENG